MVNGNQSSRFSIQNIFHFFLSKCFKKWYLPIIYKNKCIMCTVLSCGPGVRAVLLRDRRLQPASRQAGDVSAVQYSTVQYNTIHNRVDHWIFNDVLRAGAPPGPCTA